jgi:hypothetical protein
MHENLNIMPSVSIYGGGGREPKGSVQHSILRNRKFAVGKQVKKKICFSFYSFKKKIGYPFLFYFFTKPLEILFFLVYKNKWENYAKKNISFFFIFVATLWFVVSFVVKRKIKQKTQEK